MPKLAKLDVDPKRQAVAARLTELQFVRALGRRRYSTHRRATERHVADFRRSPRQGSDRPCGKRPEKARSGRFAVASSAENVTEVDGFQELLEWSQPGSHRRPPACKADRVGHSCLVVSRKYLQMPHFCSPREDTKGRRETNWCPPGAPSAFVTWGGGK